MLYITESIKKDFKLLVTVKTIFFFSTRHFNFGKGSKPDSLIPFRNLKKQYSKTAHIQPNMSTIQYHMEMFSWCHCYEGDFLLLCADQEMVTRKWCQSKPSVSCSVFIEPFTKWKDSKSKLE